MKNIYTKSLIYNFIFFLLFLSILGYAQQPKLVLPIGHTGYVRTVEFSPNGKFILTSGDVTAKLWDRNSGYLLSNFQGYEPGVQSAKFSLDGKKIIIASNDSSIKIWDVKSERLITELKGHTHIVYSAEFSSDGTKVLSNSEDGTAKLWNVTTGVIVADLKGGKITSAHFSPDEQTIITSSYDGIAKIWNANTGNLIVSLIGHTGPIYSAEYSLNGKKILTSSADGTLRVWTIEGEIKIILKANSTIHHPSFSPDGTKILTTSTFNSSTIWDANSGLAITNLIGEKEQIYLSKFSPDGKKIITAFEDGTLKIWNALNGEILTNLIGHKSKISAVNFSSDGKNIATSSWDGTAKVWDSELGILLQDFRSHTTPNKYPSVNEIGNNIILNYEIIGDQANITNIIKTWNTVTGVLLPNLEDEIKRKFKLEPLLISLDRKKVLVRNANDLYQIISVSTGAVISYLAAGTKNLQNPEFSSDGEYLVALCDTVSQLWRVTTGEHLAILKGHKSKILSASFSPNGKRIATFSNQEDGFTAKIWNTVTGKSFFQFRGVGFDVQKGFFSPDSKMLAIIDNPDDFSITIYNLDNGKKVSKLQGHTDLVSKAVFSPDGKMIVTFDWNGETRVYNVKSGFLLYKLKNLLINDVKFSNDNKLILTASKDFTSQIWNAETGEVITQFIGHNNSVVTAQFVSNNKKIVTASTDGTTKLWNSETGNLIYTFVSIEDFDYISQIPSGYYLGSQGASKLLHYVNKDKKIITFEQLDVKYNRPDKVLEEIGNPDIELINSYRKAYEKRIKKLDINPDSFRDGYSVPEADFTNRDQIKYEKTNEMLKLQIKGNDSIYKLDRYNVWVNEVPISGQRGISLKKSNSNVLDTSVSIKLSQGENRIETSITNVNGTESYRIPLYVKYIPVQPVKEKTYFIGIGIDKFADKNHNLKYSVKDIRDLAIKFKEKCRADIVIDTLFNENVTISNVKDLKKKLLETNVNDKVIISYSGHGLFSKNYDYFLSTYSIDFDDPNKKGLPYDELENLLDNIPARKKLMLIDACHSGEVDKEDLISLNATSDTLLKGNIPVAYKTNEKHLDLKNSFELMQSLFVNVGKSTGATIISAAAGTQFALENRDLKNGVFTYSILEAMQQNKTMKISELKRIVCNRVEELTKGLQKPTSRNETIAVDWSVW